MSLVCLARPSALSSSERIQWLFLIPSNPASLGQQMGVQNDSVQRVSWTRTYGQRLRLKVQFVHGTEAQQQRVRDTLRDKFDFLNVQWDFVAPEGAANIRVSFYENQHSWSSIGTEATLVPPGEPTLNLSQLSAGNILHQFAHALGFPHESEYEADLAWNAPVVDAAFAGPPHFWNTSEAMRSNFYDLVNFNVFYNWQSFDPLSLMCNLFPAEFYLAPRTSRRPVPDDFTAEDRRFMLLYYPFGQKAIGERAPAGTAPPIIHRAPSLLRLEASCSRSLLGPIAVSVLLLSVLAVALALVFRR
jgi:hypothetical protein